MTVVQVCRTWPPRIGGLEASVAGLARAMRDRGHAVRVVTLRDPPAERAGTDGRTDGIEVVRLVRIGPRIYPYALGVVRACRGASLVHVHGIDGLLDQLVDGRAAVGAPIGVSTHGAYFHTPRLRAVKGLVLRTRTRWSLRRADRVWFTSDADRDTLAPAGVDGEVLPDGVDVARFAAVVRRPEPGRLLVVGRIDVHKGLDDLIDALAPAADRPWILELVGPEHAPGTIAALTTRARSRGIGDRVRFTGALDGAGLLAALGRADRVVLPSRYEGFGIAAIEAMAARVPVVLSDIPAFRVHRDAARIVDLRAPGAADAILAPIDPGVVERAAGVADRFGWPAVAARWEQVYAELIAARTSGEGRGRR
ncbi:MAG: glycosyltransferase family 4 protein [Myxococcota bacterium]